MDFTTVLLSILTIHLMASISPGPDFVIVSQKTLLQGRRAGIFCGAGVCVGLLVHISYSVLGLAAAIQYSSDVLGIVKILGGLYLLFLGYSIVKGSFKKNSATESEKKNDSTSKSAFWSGFFVNALNPKAAVYFISLFSVVLSPSMPISNLILVVVLIICIQMAWYLTFIFVVTLPNIRPIFNRYIHFIDRILGGAMLLMGAYMFAF